MEKYHFEKTGGAAAALFLAMALAMGAGCTQGAESPGKGAPAGAGGASKANSGDKEDQFASALSSMNADWKLYEIGESRGAVTIKVEVTEIVDFKDGKRAVEAIQKIDPQFKGYIDFYDSNTGTVVRKMEIMPAPSATPADTPSAPPAAPPADTPAAG